MKRMMIVAALAALTTTTVAQAADPAAYVEYRKSVLSATSNYMKAIGITLKEDLAVPNQTADHAKAIASIMETLPAAFPEGTAGIAKTEAKAAIWKDFEAFKVASKKSQDAALELASAAETGDKAAIGAKLQALGGTCKACHKEFKAD
ncbi:cytochrome c [Rhodospirillum rubrum]|uniref:Cytochrome c' n=1 Tax=Rhodospirillum rubrum (strain ATCC 11170 / ATH 1.1.1 / DSM 467 / LMG 4362 / NCIMB 8255 / S1) TaxID=269796 RepID=CYCP_RHORT|nr:cytochrome c [Rhodospirillum rubrum]P00144.2 RecName: Full=Cytochrome c'; Flags: Precursor [Rhodospirillum rubrum ATCC 11170]ABC23056.1 Cytochrome c, class II [Rhodospirillum rubrum ATCC 11170]AEO48785.1 cytochrome c, class II [Rhodospirillum rubrum F11]MBK5954683.1 cytochrome c' [Rhodospirillum rubrum]QXG79040.1 cytochrome c [Rhodospirillum rubrum]HCF17500.1 cytochrome c' [Rhodospirillum rubrum]